MTHAIRRPFLAMTVLTWALACGGGTRTTPSVDTAPTSAEPELEAELPAAWAPDPAWTTFFEERFGQSPSVAFEVALSDEPERLARIGDSWFLFPATGEPPPMTWTVLDGVDGPASGTLDHAATLAAAPELAGALAPGAGSVTFGEPATVAVFRHAVHGEPAWVSLFPDAVSAEAAAARARAPNAFVVSQNNLLGDAGLAGEAPLDQAFCGDFDGDGRLEVVALTDGQVLRWPPGATEPTSQPVEYLGTTPRKAALRRGPLAIQAFAEHESRVEVPGDAIDIWKPEASSIVLYLDDEGWHEAFESD